MASTVQKCDLSPVKFPLKTHELTMPRTGWSSLRFPSPWVWRTCKSSHPSLRGRNWLGVGWDEVTTLEPALLFFCVVISPLCFPLSSWVWFRLGPGRASAHPGVRPCVGLFGFPVLSDGSPSGSAYVISNRGGGKKRGNLFEHGTYYRENPDWGGGCCTCGVSANKLLFSFWMCKIPLGLTLHQSPG